MSSSENINLLSSLRRTDAKAAKLLGYLVIETDKSNGLDNLWMSKDGLSPAKDDIGNELELPFFSSSDQDALDLMMAVASACSQNGIGPVMELTFSGLWQFRIGDRSYSGDFAQIVTKGIVEYFSHENEGDDGI